MIFLERLDFRTPILGILQPELKFLSEKIARIATPLIPLIHACPPARRPLHVIALLSYVLTYKAEDLKKPLLEETRNTKAAALTPSVLQRLFNEIQDSEIKEHFEKARIALQAKNYAKALSELEECKKAFPEPLPHFFNLPAFTEFKTAQEAVEKASVSQVLRVLKIIGATITLFFDPNRLPIPAFLKSILLATLVESLEGNFFKVIPSFRGFLKSPRKELLPLSHKVSYFFSFALNEGISSSFWKTAALLTQALCDLQKSFLRTRTVREISFVEAAFHCVTTITLMAGRIFHASRFHSSLPSSREDARSVLHATGGVLKALGWFNLALFCIQTLNPTPNTET